MLYLLVINILTFLTYGLDKWKARRNKWRVPEKTLLLMTAIGGSLGAVLGMGLFHHKTKKWKFRLLVPVCLAVHVIGTIWLWRM